MQFHTAKHRIDLEASSGQSPGRHAYGASDQSIHDRLQSRLSDHVIEPCRKGHVRVPRDHAAGLGHWVDGVPTRIRQRRRPWALRASVAATKKGQVTSHRPLRYCREKNPGTVGTGIQSTNEEVEETSGGPLCQTVGCSLAPAYCSAIRHQGHFGGGRRAGVVSAHSYAIGACRGARQKSRAKKAGTQATRCCKVARTTDLRLASPNGFTAQCANESISQQ